MLAFGLPPRTVLVGGIGTAIGATLSTSTVVQALVLGVLTVAIAPLLTLRRTRRMDIPSTLRVME